MREKLLWAINKFWWDKITPELIMRDFFNLKIYYYYSVLKCLELDHTSRIAIMASKSFDWIALYIASLLKGVSMLIIPYKMDIWEKIHNINLTQIQYVFTDSYSETTKTFVDKNMEEIENILTKSPFLRGIFSLDKKKMIVVRKPWVNICLSISPLKDENFKLEQKDLENILNESYTNDAETIITPTSGVEYPENKLVVSSSNSIDSLISKAIDLIPYDYGDKVYSNIDFSTSHILTVMIPFIKGCIFVDNRLEANYVIEDSITFKTVWYNVVDSIMENNIVNFFLSKRLFYFLYKFIARDLLISHYNRGEKIKKVIIYNDYIPERIKNVIKNKFPLFTTYGSQESNQLIAYNDYSNKILKSKNCVGSFIRGYEHSFSKQELLIFSKSMFSEYFADKAWTNFVKGDIWYKTGDVGYTCNNYLFIKGRKKCEIEGVYRLPVQVDYIERMIGGNPYVKESIIIKVEDEGDDPSKINGAFKLFVYPNVPFVESKNMGLIELKKLLDMYLEKINSELYPFERIESINISSEPLNKTFDGKIKRHLYL